MKKPDFAPCHYCHRRLFGAEITLDHKTPKSAGGTKRRSNLVFACEVCNLCKGRTQYAMFLIQISLAPIDTSVPFEFAALKQYQRQRLRRVRALGIFAEINGETWVVTAPRDVPVVKPDRVGAPAVAVAAHG